MKYVLDSAVALKWVLPEIHAGKAKQLRDDYDNQIHELIAPDVFPIEVAHALVRAERRRSSSSARRRHFWRTSCQELASLP